jgi:drug/metabolite transporter superfamily protein YnfA
MKFSYIFLILTIAAALEVAGDALIRNGLHASGLTRLSWLVGGACVLAMYGTTVNLGPWNFGRVLGIYVVLFFIIAQLVNWFAYGIRPDASILVGGALISGGGLVLMAGR